MMVGPLPGTVSSTGEVPGQIACAPLGRVGSNPTPGATHSISLLRLSLMRFRERHYSPISRKLNPSSTAPTINWRCQDSSSASYQHTQGRVRNKVDHQQIATKEL